MNVSYMLRDILIHPHLKLPICVSSYSNNEGINRTADKLLFCYSALTTHIEN